MYIMQTYQDKTPISLPAFLGSQDEMATRIFVNRIKRAAAKMNIAEGKRIQLESWAKEAAWSVTSGKRRMSSLHTGTINFEIRKVG